MTVGAKARMRLGCTEPSEPTGRRVQYKQSEYHARNHFLPGFSTSAPCTHGNPASLLHIRVCPPGHRDLPRAVTAVTAVGPPDDKTVPSPRTPCGSIDWSRDADCRLEHRRTITRARPGRRRRRAHPRPGG